jgi:hypothetical protein
MSHPTQLFDYHCKLLLHVGSSRPCVCHVVRFSLTRCKLVRISMSLSKMSDDLLTVFKRSNLTFIMLILFIRMILATLLSRHGNNQKLIEYLCMFRIGCKPIYANHFKLC